NHLSTDSVCPFICSIPSEECPYHNLGFSLVGFTAFHLIRFRTSYVTVALFREPHPYVQSTRRIYSRRQCAMRKAPAYFFAEHGHYGHLRTVRAWTFLYNLGVAAIT